MRAARLPALLLGSGLTLVPVLALASPAYAAGAITTPGDGTPYDDPESSVRLEARVEANSGTTSMQVVEPGGAAHTVGSVGRSGAAQTLAYTFDPSCPTYPGLSCSSRPAVNGTWTVRLAGGATDSRTFSLRLPARAPAVSGTATGPRTVVLTWPRGDESDLLGYTVVDGSGTKVADADDACSGDTCRATVTYDEDGPRTETLAVKVARACPDCGGPLTTTSAPVRVDRPAPPASEPATQGGSTGGGEPAGGTGSSTPGSTGGSGTAGSTSGGGSGTSGTGTSGSGTGTGTGGTTGSGGAPAGGTGGTGSGSGQTPGSGQAPGGGPGTGRTDATPAESAKAFALGFSTFGPKLGLPKLPPLPASGVALPDVATALPDGSFDPNLPFGSKEVTERVPASASGPVGRVSSAVASVVDTDRLVRSVAGALVLLMAGAHVRRFLAQDAPDL